MILLSDKYGAYIYHKGKKHRPLHNQNPFGNFSCAKDCSLHPCCGLECFSIESEYGIRMTGVECDTYFKAYDEK